MKRRLLLRNFIQNNRSGTNDVTGIPIEESDYKRGSASLTPLSNKATVEAHLNNRITLNQ